MKSKKDYRLSKATNSKQRLETVERHLNKIIENFMKLKFDNQLELAIICIKNKLLEQTKEVKEFKFQQKVSVECKKEEKVFQETNLQIHGLIHTKLHFRI